MAPRLSLLLAILTIWAVGHAHSAHHHSSAASPAPSVDCSTLILNMADCLSFVSSGSVETKPAGTCCSGLKTVLKTDAECLCEAFKSSASLGVTLNVTKALSLPTACKVSAPAASNCGLSLAPAGAPGLSPSGIAGAPTMSVGSNEVAPAPAPGSSGSSLLSVSVGSLVVGLVVAFLSGF